MKGAERRRFSRVNVKLEADLYTGDAVMIACETKDISLQGLYLATDQQVPLGTDCQVVLWLCGVEPPLLLTMNAQVVRSDPDGVGIEVYSVQGLASYHHLLNILVMNSEDPDKIYDEATRRNSQARGKP